jgi:CRISPR-associated protein Csd1
MILQSLVDHYEILSQANEIPKPGYAMMNVSLALSLSADGTVNEIIPLRVSVQRGKKSVEIPQRMEVPEPFKRASNIQPNFLCDNAAYVLGIDLKEKPERARDCFAAFKKMHHQILDGLDSSEAKAVLAFLDAWKPENALQSALIQENTAVLSAGGNIVFHVSGFKNYVHDLAPIRRAWKKYKENLSAEEKRPCLVTGETRPIARLHPSIKGVRGAQSMGASIVSFNARAYESYGYDEEQGLNAPVSEYAAFAYTTV